MGDTGITRVKVRAKVGIGDLTVATPYVKSFNVNQARGQISTFDVSLMVSHDDIKDTITGDSVVIEAGEEGKLKKIFQGIARKAKIAPCWEDPKYVILSVSGEDILSQLRGKKFSRRCRSQLSCWTTIDDVVRDGLKSDKFLFQGNQMWLMDGAKPLKENQVIHYKGSIPHEGPGGAKASNSQGSGDVTFAITFAQPGGS